LDSSEDEAPEVQDFAGDFLQKLRDTVSVEALIDETGDVQARATAQVIQDLFGNSDSDSDSDMAPILDSAAGGIPSSDDSMVLLPVPVPLPVPVSLPRNLLGSPLPPRRSRPPNPFPLIPFALSNGSVAVTSTQRTGKESTGNRRRTIVFDDDSIDDDDDNNCSEYSGWVADGGGVTGDGRPRYEGGGAVSRSPGYGGGDKTLSTKILRSSSISSSGSSGIPASTSNVPRSISRSSGYVGGDMSLTSVTLPTLIPIVPPLSPIGILPMTDTGPQDGIRDPTAEVSVDLLVVANTTANSHKGILRNTTDRNNYRAELIARTNTYLRRLAASTIVPQKELRSAITFEPGLSDRISIVRRVNKRVGLRGNTKPPVFLSPTLKGKTHNSRRSSQE
jgi:hypothetical protein